VFVEKLQRKCVAIKLLSFNWILKMWLICGSEVAKGNGHSLIRRKDSEFYYRRMNDAKYCD
jgi:hypothetical protein